MGFDADLVPDNFADSAVSAPDTEKTTSGEVTIPPPQANTGPPANEQEPPLGPPPSKKARTDAQPTVSIRHPVSELVQKYQGAMFVCTGTRRLKA